MGASKHKRYLLSGGPCMEDPILSGSLPNP